MMTPRERKLLEGELEKAKKLSKDRTYADLMPEEKALLKETYPGSGYHKHDESNPFGMHRHYVTDKIDGAHTHTPQNPQGEHVHGEFEGRALIDGAHSHKGCDGLGYHGHKRDEN